MGYRFGGTSLRVWENNMGEQTATSTSAVYLVVTKKTKRDQDGHSEDLSVNDQMEFQEESL